MPETLYFGMMGLAVDPFSVFIWLIAITAIVAFSAVLIIGTWIGFTTATTSPPAPIEELEAELSARGARRSREKRRSGRRARKIPPYRPY